jgi:hypothetical protein
MYPDAGLRWKFAEKQLQSLLPGLFGFTRGFKIDVGMSNRSPAAGTIDFPSPRFWQPSLILCDNGKVSVLKHW